MVAGVPPRIRWAVEVVAAGPADRLLEVGCGPGLAAGLVCDRLVTGRLLAVDRSAVAVRRATQRNALHVEAGRLEVRHGELATLETEPASLDGAFAVDVNVFWVGDPERELAVLSRALQPGGVLHLLYGANGPTSGARILDPIAAALDRRGFAGIEVRTSGDGLGVSARAPA